MNTLALGIFLLLCSTNVSTTQMKEINTRLQLIYDHVVSSTTMAEKEQSAFELASMIGRMSPEEVRQVKESSIQNILVLVSNENEVVRYQAIKSLGALGCKARNALPRLKEIANSIENDEVGDEPFEVGSSVSIGTELSTAIHLIEHGACEP